MRFIRTTNLLFFFSLFFGNVNSLTASALAEIKVYLSAVDDFSGGDLKVEFRAESRKTGNSYPIKEEDGLKFIILKSGDDVKIKAILDEFYPEEKILVGNDIMEDETEIVFRMMRRPTARLVLKAKDQEKNREIPASFEVTFQGKVLGKGNTSRTQTSYEISLNENGIYQVKSEGVGFDDSITEIDVQVGTPANRIERVIDLMHPAETIFVKMIDEQTGTPVSGKLVIIESGTNKEVFDQNLNNGSTKFSFENGKKYLLRFLASDYKDFEYQVENAQKSDVILRVRPMTFMTFKATDKESGKFLEADFMIKSPSGKEIKLSGTQERKLKPEEKGNYQVIVYKEGYVQKNGTAMVNNLSGGSMEFSFSLDRTDNQFHVTIIDKYTREKLPAAELKVFSQGGNALVELKPDEKLIWNFSTESNKKYFIEVTCPEYMDYTHNLDNKEKDVTVELGWLPKDTYVIYLKDIESKKLIPGSKLKIVDSHGSEIFVFQTPDQGVFKAHLKKNSNYSYGILADRYAENVADITNLDGNQQELFFKRKNSKETTLVFQDRLTGNAITPAVNFGLLSKNNSSVEPDENGKFISTFNSDNEYFLEANLVEYKPYKKTFKKGELSDRQMTLDMEKSFYPVNFRIINMTKITDYKDVILKIFDSNNKRFNESLDNAALVYNVEIAPDQEYTVQIIKNGYQNIIEKFNGNDLIKSAKAKEFELIEIPKVVVKEAEKEPVAKEEKPIVKEEPVKLVVPDVLDILSKVPGQSSDLEKELKDKGSIGKRYFLDKVFFDQSSAKITEEEVAQLNTIAETLKKSPEVIIEIVGYTDNIGDPRLNKGLSNFRAKAVANYLFNKGANPNNIRVLGKGDTDPLAPNDTEENRAKNRRVEMVLIKN